MSASLPSAGAFAAVTLLAAAFRGVTGFGYALSAALGLATFDTPMAGVSFILFADLLLTVALLLDREQGEVDWSVTAPLLLFGFFGSLCGSLLAAHLDQATSRLLISAAMVVTAFIAMMRTPPRWLGSTALGAVFAFIVGATLAAFAVGGPLIAGWMLARGYDRRVLKGTLAVFFGAVDAWSLVSRGMFGALDSGILDTISTRFPHSRGLRPAASSPGA